MRRKAYKPSQELSEDMDTNEYIMMLLGALQAVYSTQTVLLQLLLKHDPKLAARWEKVFAPAMESAREIMRASDKAPNRYKEAWLKGWDYFKRQKYEPAMEEKNKKKGKEK